MADQPQTPADKPQDKVPEGSWSAFQQDVVHLYKLDGSNRTAWADELRTANKMLDDSKILPNLEITGVDEKTGNVVLHNKQGTQYGSGAMSFEIDNNGKIVDVVDQGGNEWKNQNGVWAEFDHSGKAILGSDGNQVTSISQVGFDKEGNFIISNPNTHTMEIYGTDGSIKVVDASPQRPGFATPGAAPAPGAFPTPSPENAGTSAHQNSDGTWTVVPPGGTATTYNAQGQPISTGTDR